MRMKTYSVDNLAEAVTKIRNEMGNNAVIVSTVKKIKRDYLLRPKKYLEVVAMSDASNIRDVEQVLGLSSVRKGVSEFKEAAKHTVAPIISEVNKIKNSIVSVAKKQKHVHQTIDEVVKLNIVDSEYKIPTEKKSLSAEDYIMRVVKSMLWHGVHQSYVSSLAEAVSTSTTCDENYIKEKMADNMLSLIPACADVLDVCHDKRLIVITGGKSCGKSLSMVKLAAQLYLNGTRKIAFISATDEKNGVDDTVRQMASILEVPCGYAKNQREFNKQLERFSGFDNVLIEMSESAMSWLTNRDRNEINISYVLPIDGNLPSDSEEVCLSSDNLIVTYLDNVSKFGNLLNFTLDLNKPYLAFMTGTAIPEDYEQASSERIVDCILNFSGKHPALLEETVMRNYDLQEVIQ